MTDSKRKTHKLMIELDEHTFAFLEVLAVGLNREQPEIYPYRINKERDDFSPMVRQLLEHSAEAIADGVRRRGSWEADIVNAVFGWQGTYVPASFAPRLKEIRLRGYDLS